MRRSLARIRPGAAHPKTWAPRAAIGGYGLLLLAATMRAWLKVDADFAGKVLAFGLVFGLVLWRAWLHVLGFRFGGWAQSTRRRR